MPFFKYAESLFAHSHEASWILQETDEMRLNIGNLVLGSHMRHHLLGKGCVPTNLCDQARKRIGPDTRLAGSSFSHGWIAKVDRKMCRIESLIQLRFWYVTIYLHRIRQIKTTNSFA